jgi:SAM-dependent methyltransferase
VSLRPYPLDLEAGRYSYLERPNRALLELAVDALGSGAPNVLDVGAGAGANTRELRRRLPEAFLVGVEPNAKAAALARAACDEVFEGPVDRFFEHADTHRRFDLVLLSDVLEHLVDPLSLLRTLRRHPSTRDAALVVSVPNYAVWYNRAKTLAGAFSYSWSGLYDRTHLRFFTRRSLRELLERAGLSIEKERSTPSIVQSGAPLLRRLFDAELEAGDHLSLAESRAFRAYDRFVEPVESRLCALWPELLGFQIVVLCAPNRELSP